jgi:hypothetical protein
MIAGKYRVFNVLSGIQSIITFTLFSDEMWNDLVQFEERCNMTSMHIERSK